MVDKEYEEYETLSDEYKKTTDNRLRNLSENRLKLYAITADYRPRNENRPVYYVLGMNPEHAKKKFSYSFDWLKIYGCELYDYEEARKIILHPTKHIVM